MQTLVQQMSSYQREYSSDEMPGLVLPSLEAIHQCLKDDVDWPSNTIVQDVHYRRLWAARRGNICFELNISLMEGDRRRDVTLQGGTGLSLKSGRCHKQAKLSTNGLMGLRLYSDKINAWLCSPDRDKGIQWMPELLSRSAVGQLLEPHLSKVQNHHNNQQNHKRPHLELVAYRANRRCVVRACYKPFTKYTGFFIKGFRRLPPSCDAGFLRRLAEELSCQSEGIVGIPTPILLDPIKCIVVTAQTAADAKRLQLCTGDVEVAAHALARLHACEEVTTLKSHSNLDELHTLSRWLKVLPCICGQDVINRLQQNIAKLAMIDQNQAVKSNVIVHRDYYFSQLLRDGERVWLVDLDTLCTGEREVDVATFLAHLVLDSDACHVNDPPLGVLAADFVDSYCKHGGVIDERRLAFYIPCAMLRLGAIYQARSKPKAVSMLWHTAESLLSQSLTITSILETIGRATS